MAKAKQILLDTTNFDGVLSGDDTEVQKAMETLDDAVGGGAGALNDLSDVVITGPANLDLLQYDAESGEWVDRSLAEAGVLALAGGTMTGGLNMGGKAVDNVDYLDVGTVIERDRAYFNAYRRTAFDMPASNTWYDYPWSLPATVKVNCTHDHASDPEEITLDKAGTYLITYSITSYGTGQATMRLLDDDTEIAGSWAHGTAHYGELWCRAARTIEVSIVAGSVVKLQVSTNVAGSDIAFHLIGATPTTHVAASISIVRIGP